MKFDEPKSIHEAGDSVVSAGATTHEAFLAAILNSATDYAIFTLDCERRVTSWNVGACNLVGYGPEEIIGQSGDIIFTPEDLEAGAPQAEENAVRSTGRAEDERWQLEMARRHVVEGEERCARQAALIRRTAANGLDTLEAEGLLAQFEGPLELSSDHLRRLEAEAG